jgi:hypothetical protein
MIGSGARDVTLLRFLKLAAEVCSKTRFGHMFAIVLALGVVTREPFARARPLWPADAQPRQDDDK